MQSLHCMPSYLRSVGLGAFSTRNTGAARLIVIKQAHLHVADAPISIQIHAREPVPQAVLVSSIFFAEHEVHVVFVRHRGPGIRSVFISSSLGKRPWTHRHDPEQKKEHAIYARIVPDFSWHATPRTTVLPVWDLHPKLKLASLAGFFRYAYTGAKARHRHSSLRDSEYRRQYGATMRKLHVKASEVHRRY